MEGIDPQTVFNALGGICGVLISYYLYSVREDMKDMRKSIREVDGRVDGVDKRVNETELLVAGQYLKREELQQTMTRLEEKLDKNFTRVFEKLDRKADK